MSQSATPNRPAAKPGARFRSEIDAAVASGASLDDLVLNLTLMDTSKLKRDPEVALSDISFNAGEMRYLGVRVKQGGVTSSRLGPADAETADEPVAEVPAKKPKAKAKPKKAAAAAAPAGA